MSSDSSKKILVVRTDHIGDIILTTPLLRAFARHGHIVDALVSPTQYLVIQRLPYLRRAINIGDIAPSFPRQWISVAAWLRKQDYDILAICYGRPYQIMLASLLSGISIRLVMTGGILGRLTFHRCLRSKLLAQPRHYADVVMDLGRCLGVRPDGLQTDVVCDKAQRSRMKKELNMRLPTTKIFIGVHPGSNSNSCNLPPQQYAEIVRLLLDRDPSVGVVITGIEAEKALLSGWPSEIRQSDRVWNTMGSLSIEELTGLISNFDVLICGSTGPLHVANALGIKIVAAFCARPEQSARVWGHPEGSERCRVLSPDFDGCLRRKPHQRCDMRGQISAWEMANAVEEMLRL